MNNPNSAALCVVGLAYFEAYVPQRDKAPSPGTEEFVSSLDLSIGGAFNSAIVASALGFDCTLACPLGNGLADAAVRHRLSAAKDLKALTWNSSDDPAVSIVYGANTDRSFLSRADWSSLANCPSLENFAWVHVAGLPEAAQLKKQLEEASSAGASLSLSASWHPELLSQLAERDNHFWDVLFLNELEACAGESGKQDLEAFSTSAKMLVLTEGKAGARVILDGKSLRCPPRDAVVSNVTGAGDAFAAGFVCGMIEHKDPQIALDWGSRAATFYISRDHAERFNLSSESRQQILK